MLRGILTGTHQSGLREWIATAIRMSLSDQKALLRNVPFVRTACQCQRVTRLAQGMRVSLAILMTQTA
jgi:hypothetical protein